MRVLLVSGDFTTWGGMDRANYELAWYLAEQAGAKVHVVAYFVAEPLASHPNVVWRRVLKPLNSYALGAYWLTHAGKAEARQVEDQGGSIVVVNGGNCPWPGINWVHAIQEGWKCRNEHAPIQVKIRQWVSEQSNLRAEKKALQVASMVVANSELTRAQLIRDLKVPPDRVRTIYYGSDPQMFHPATAAEKRSARISLGWPADTLTSIFVGALGHDRRKGFDILFRAWIELCSDPSWDVDLVAAGGGADVLYWRSQAEHAGLSKRIRLLGFTKDIPTLIRAADVMVHPVFYEAYGLGVHEALCSGIPALVTRTAGVAERYPANLSGLLLEHPPSAENLVACLRRWRAEKDGFRARVLEFSAELRRRTWADMAQEFVEVAMPSLKNVSASLA